MVCLPHCLHEKTHEQQRFTILEVAADWQTQTTTLHKHLCLDCTWSHTPECTKCPPPHWHTEVRSSKLIQYDTIESLTIIVETLPSDEVAI